MKNKFRILSSIMTVMLMLSSFQTVASANDNLVITQKNIPSQKYVDTVDFLSAVDIYSFNERSFNENVTRGEFAKMAVDFLGANGADIELNVSPFYDVTAETPYAAEIIMANKMGLMNGVGGGAFNPEASITYNQAVITLVRALGYDVYAKLKGAQNFNYIDVAKQVGMLKDKGANYEAPLTFEFAAYLIRRTAECNVLEIVSVSKDNTALSNKNTQTVLEIYHDISIGTGKMTDNGLTALDTESRVSDNMTVIGRHELRGITDEARKLIGQKLKYYYRKGNEFNTLLYAQPEENKNEVVTINASELACDSADFKKTCVVTDVNGKKEKYNIYIYANLIYNGVNDPTFTAESLKINQGTLTLIDSDNDDVFETVIADEYVNIVLRSIDSDGKKMYAKYSPDQSYNTIDFAEKVHSEFFDASGQSVNTKDVTEGTVASVFRSHDGKVVRTILSAVTEDIKIDSVLEDEDFVITSGDKDYKLSYTYYFMMKNGSAIYKKPLVTTNYKAYLDFEGNIAYLDEVDSRMQYAYFMAIGTENANGINSSKIQLKLVLESGDAAIVNVAKKVTINKMPGKTPEDVNALSVLYNNEGNALQQLVRVRLNSKGELTEIETAVDATSSTFKFDLNNFSLDYKKSGSSSVYAGANVRSIGGLHCVGKDTVFFMITEPTPSLNTINEENVKVINFDAFLQDGASSQIQLYDADEAWMCGAALVSSKTSLEARPFIVESCKTIIDSYGTEKMMITGWWKDGYWRMYETNEGTFKTAIDNYFMNNDVNEISPDSLMPGDVIRVNFDLNDDIDRLEIMYSPQREKDKDPYIRMISGDRNDVPTATTVAMVGSPYVIDDTRIGVYTKGIGNDAGRPVYYVNMVQANAIIRLFDADTKEFKLITLKEIPATASVSADGTSLDVFDEGTRVYIHKSKSLVTDIFVVTNLDR